MDKLKSFLDEKAAQYNTSQFIDNDPVRFPHSFHKKEDIEISALLVSIIAWGNRQMILKSSNKMLYDIMGGQPHYYIMHGEWNALEEGQNIHRTFFVRDFIYLCRALKDIYTHHSSLEELFVNKPVWDGINNLRCEIAKSNEGKFSRHVSCPIKEKGGSQASACKRLHMMLRWLCRRDKIVDLGIWETVSPSRLMIPLDVHVARMGRQLGLITRTSNDRRTVEELTLSLSKFCPEDPVKYDFALFGIGESGEIEKHII